MASSQPLNVSILSTKNSTMWWRHFMQVYQQRQVLQAQPFLKTFFNFFPSERKNKKKEWQRKLPSKNRYLRSKIGRETQH